MVQRQKNNANDYHDYVIKDGIFIGRFEEMYKNCEDPWKQSSWECNKHSRMGALINIQRYGIKSLVEVGCGLGYYTRFIYENTGIKIKGVDISRTAIKEAKKRWPDLDFEVNDVKNLTDYTKFDAILFAEVVWYILKDLDYLFHLMLSKFPDKYFINNLVFYKGQQKYGKEYFTNLEEFIDYVPFELLDYVEATNNDDGVIQTSTIFRIKQKKSELPIRSIKNG